MSKFFTDEHGRKRPIMGTGLGRTSRMRRGKVAADVPAIQFTYRDVYTTPVPSPDQMAAQVESYPASSDVPMQEPILTPQELQYRELLPNDEFVAQKHDQDKLSYEQIYVNYYQKPRTDMQ